MITEEIDHCRIYIQMFIKNVGIHSHRFAVRYASRLCPAKRRSRWLNAAWKNKLSESEIIKGNYKQRRREREREREKCAEQEG